LVENLTIEALGERKGPIVRDVSFALERGQVLGLFGPSGSGKSSILRAIAGLIPAKSNPRGRVRWAPESRRFTGRVEIGQRDVTLLPPRDRGIGYVPQSLALFDDQNVRANLAFPLVARPVLNRRDVEATVETMARSLGIAALLDQAARDISGGQRQRVAIGRALINRPSLVLMDEPLANLDASLKTDVMRLLCRSLKEAQACTVYVTHEHAEATELCDVVAFLEKGALHQVASPAEAYQNPKTLFVAQSFSGFVNVLPGTLDTTGRFWPLGLNAHWPISEGTKGWVAGGGQMTLAGREGGFRLARDNNGIPGVVSRTFVRQDCHFARVHIGGTLEIDVAMSGQQESEGARVSVTLADASSLDIRLYDWSAPAARS
jgi:ABC-type sugar transport system ATPase subunit